MNILESRGRAPRETLLKKMGYAQVSENKYAYVVSVDGLAVGLIIADALEGEGAGSPGMVVFTIFRTGATKYCNPSFNNVGQGYLQGITNGRTTLVMTKVSPQGPHAESLRIDGDRRWDENTREGSFWGIDQEDILEACKHLLFDDAKSQAQVLRTFVPIPLTTMIQAHEDWLWIYNKGAREEESEICFLPVSQEVERGFRASAVPPHIKDADPFLLRCYVKHLGGFYHNTAVSAGIAPKMFTSEFITPLAVAARVPEVARRLEWAATPTVRMEVFMERRTGSMSIGRQEVFGYDTSTDGLH